MSSTKIGLILPHIGPSSLSFYTINQINYISNINPNYDFVLFIDNLVRPYILPNCAVMHANEIFSFDGVLISTNISSAIACSKAVNCAKNIFYVWDLEWLRGQNNFVHNMSAFRNPNLRLVARSEHHKKAIENYCNKKVDAVIPDINLMEIANLCH